MKTPFFWAMLLGDAYAVACIYLLLKLISDTEMPLFTFTQIRS
jgi:hypothetical protein